MKLFKPSGASLRRWCVLVPLGVLVLVFGFWGYRALEQQRAAVELRKLGLEAGGRDFLQAVRGNWRVVFSSRFYKDRAEWSGRVRLMSTSAKDLRPYESALARFRPREVLLGFCSNLEDVSVLRNFPDLERLDFYECPKVKDIGIVSQFLKLRELTFRRSPSLESLGIIRSGANLVSLHISDCRNLNDLNALQELPSLRSLYLSGVPTIQDAELLRSLALLEELDLSACKELSDISGLHGLKSLKHVNLRGCSKLSAESVVELRGALPNAKILFP